VLFRSYELQGAKTFTNTVDGVIDTGVKLFEDVSGQPKYTMVFEFSADENMENVGGKYCLLHCMTESDPWPGLCVQTTTGGRTQLNLYSRSQPYGTYTGDATAKLKTYIQIKGTQFRTGTDPAADSWGTITGYSTNVPQSLLLGAYQDTDGTKGRYWDGTLERFEVYDKELTNEQISAWLNE